MKLDVIENSMSWSFEKHFDGQMYDLLIGTIMTVDNRQWYSAYAFITDSKDEAIKAYEHLYEALHFIQFYEHN